MLRSSEAIIIVSMLNKIIKTGQWMDQNIKSRSPRWMQYIERFTKGEERYDCLM